MSGAAMVGLVPTRRIDIPISAVFIALFVGMAASHMTIFRRNLSRGHKFLFNALLFGFSMSRIAANAFRIAWATQPTNANLELVETIFVNAGILLVYIVNNILTWRLIRSRLPSFGWHRLPRTLYKAQLFLLAPIIITLIIIIVVVTKLPTLYHQAVLNKVARFAQTYFFIIAAQPLILIPFAALWPTNEYRDEFGSGSWAIKVGVLFASTCLATVEAAFRLGANWAHPRPATNPAWYQSKASFYCFNFVIDILLLGLFLAARIDKRFHVPNKSEGPGSYSAGRKERKQTDGEEGEES